MPSVNYDSIVSKNEVQALKEMIFKRARERAEALAGDVQSSFTDSVQNDIMEVARNSFVKNNNPFLKITNEQKFAETEEKSTETQVESKENTTVGFPPRHVENLKAQINYRNRIANETVANSAIESSMNDAGADFRKKQTFLGALEFLNAQASIALVNSSGNKFNAIA